MEKVRFRDAKRTSKWILPAGIVALGFTVAAASQPSQDASKAAVAGENPSSSQTQAPESPAPSAEPKVTINGQAVPTDKEGSTSVDIPGGKARVEVSEGSTQVATSSSGSGDTSNSQSSKVNVSITSQSDGGTSWSSTQVYGSSSKGSGTSFKSTSTVRTDAGYVSITQK